MVYKWKLPGMYDVSAQTAVEELSRIYQERGELQAADVVEESRPETAPLHGCFEWNDSVAAEKYREEQARGIIQCVVSVQNTTKHGSMEVRAFVHVEDSYRPTQVVISEKSLHDELLKSAIRDVEEFQRRLELFSSLRPVKQLRRTIDRTIQQLREEQRP